MLIEDLDEEEKERLMVDTGEDIQVMRVFIADLPPALSLEVLKEVADRQTGSPRTWTWSPTWRCGRSSGWWRSCSAGGRG